MKASAGGTPTRPGSWLRRLMGDVFLVARQDKKWWLVPLILLLLVLAAILVFAVAFGPLSPFIYQLV